MISKRAIEVCGKTYRQSREIKERIISFDRGDKVLPFTICFDLKLKAATLGPDLFFIPLLTILQGKMPLSD